MRGDIQMFHVQQITAVVLMALGIHEGTWKLCVEMGTKVCDVQSAEHGLVPGVVQMVQRVGVARCPVDYPAAVDAALAYRQALRLERERESFSGCWDDALRDLEG